MTELIKIYTEIKSILVPETVCGFY